MDLIGLIVTIMVTSFAFICCFWFGTLIYKANMLDDDTHSKRDYVNVYKIYYKYKDKDDWLDWPGTYDNVNQAREVISQSNESLGDKFDFLLCKDILVLKK